MRHLAAVQRQVDHLFRLDHLANTGVLCFDHGGIGLHLNGLCHGAYLKTNVDRGIGIHLQHDPRLDVLGESFL